LVKKSERERKPAASVRKANKKVKRVESDEDQVSDIDAEDEAAVCEQCDRPTLTPNLIKFEKGREVSWIQCDACMRKSWYHIVCVTLLVGNNSVWDIDNIAVKWFCQQCLPNPRN